MRRYIFNGDLSHLEVSDYDVVIVGDGLAGIYTALNLPETLKILVTSKKDKQVSSSWFAQGGIASVLMPGDNFESHIQDTLVAGAGECDEAAVRTLVTEGPTQIKRILRMGIPFDLAPDGQLECGREGGHSFSRIIHSGKDATGKQLVIGLGALMESRANITVREDVFCTDVVTDENGGVCGILLYDNGFEYIRSANVVLCTGGIGRIYKYTTNPSTSTGDGIAAAARAGAVIKNMEFVQFHPTALALPDAHGQMFLISEAVRGDGGLLYDETGRRIMEGRHELEDLAPRDIVSREIFKRMRETGTDKVYLDIKYKGEDFVIERFPTIYENCLKYGINVAKELIPVIPVQHYFMGGVVTDLYAKTNIDGLYCVGESSCTGVHGANRLASNSLLECLVFGNRCAEYIGQNLRPAPQKLPSLETQDFRPDRARVNDYRERIRATMFEDGGIVRNAKSLKSGIGKLTRIIDDLSDRRLNNIHHAEALNMAFVGCAVLEGALARRESAGGHYREDTIYD